MRRSQQQWKWLKIQITPCDVQSDFMNFTYQNGKWQNLIFDLYVDYNRHLGKDPTRTFVPVLCVGSSLQFPVPQWEGNHADRTSSISDAARLRWYLLLTLSYRERVFFKCLLTHLQGVNVNGGRYSSDHGILISFNSHTRPFFWEASNWHPDIMFLVKEGRKSVN